METTNNEKLKINLEKLQNQVRSELLADEKYQRENSAKLRAVEQRVPTYEDFRQMVLASHLRPLDKGESLANNLKTSPKVWNSAVNGPSQLDSTSRTLSSDAVSQIDAILSTTPTSSLELAKTWTRLEQTGADSNTKWTFLTRLGQPKLAELLRTEITGDLLAKFLDLFNERLEDESRKDKETTGFIVDMLRIFTKSNRFGLNVMFLSRQQVDTCRILFERLESLGFELTDLKKLYF